MGNALIYQDYEDPPGPGKGLDFFQSLNMKTVELFFRLIRDSGTDMELKLVENQVSVLTWRNYSRIFSQVREVLEADAEDLKRLIWHPATNGYVMRPGLLPPLRDGPPPPDYDEIGAHIPADFTDDDASDTEEESDSDAEKGELEDDDDKSNPDKESTEEIDGDGISKKDKKSKKGSVKKDASDRIKRDASWVPDEVPLKRKQRHVGGKTDDSRDGGEQRKSWDPKLVSPIFFGYHHTTTKDVRKEKNDELTKNQAAESRAIASAQNARASVLSVASDNAKKMADTRLKKIDEIERRYAAATARREDELSKNRKDLPQEAFAIFKRKWDSEYDAAEAAFAAEVGQLRYIHMQKSEVEEANLVKRTQEMEAFKDAEKQEMPAAERLEEIARIEISRWIEELDTCSTKLEESRREYAEMRDELETIMLKGVNKRNEKQLRELRSVVNHAEGMVRERQKLLENAVQSLEDAEALFDRALRLKKQQDELLPLFRLLARENLPSSVRLDYFVCALTVFMSGTYEQKWSLIFNLFDSANHLNGFFDSEIIYHILILFQETLHRMNYIAFTPRKEELHNTIWRAFLDLGLRPGREVYSDRMTQYETRMMIMAIIGHSAQLSKLLGFKKNAYNTGKPFTTYQRNRMGAYALIARGLSIPSSTKFRLHYECTKYWKEQTPKHRQFIHERAMMMGEEDPLKPDYSRYMAKEKKKYRSTIPPLEHGHLHNSKFINDVRREEAATKIQAMLRAHRDRKMSELAAKKQAFQDARDQANEQMKNKIVLEFKKREDLTGMAKMKWDAQVRMKQAKLKASGQKVNRGNTVMLMMEEAISKAREEISARFTKLEQQEDFSTKSFEFKENIYAREVKVNKDLLGVLDLRAKAAVDQVAVEAMKKQDKYKAEDDKSVADDKSVENSIHTILGENEEKGDASDEVRHTDKEPILGGIDLIRAEDMLKGTYKFDNKAKGETSLETDLMYLMRGSDPSWLFLLYRLRAVNKAFTIFKTKGVLAELPSKRLLLQYIEASSEEKIAVDLKLHFRFTRDHLEIAKFLKNVLKTDFERGLLWEELRQLQDHLEYGVRSAIGARLTEKINVEEANLKRKLETNESITEAKVLQMDLDRATKFYNRYQGEAKTILDAILKQTQIFKKVLLSVSETKRRLHVTQLLKKRREGDLMGEKDPLVFLEDRQNWVMRLKTAMHIKEKSIKEAETKWAEIRTVCREFIDVATADALILINEHNQPKYKKTIPISREFNVHNPEGRESDSGRGFESKHFIYEAHNIEYTVVVDYNGIFNGSDEQAMKMAGKERLGALEYLKTHTDKLNTGLVITVDYAGYRVLGVAKLPIEHVVFNDEGEIKKISEDRVHGFSPGGEMFISKHKIAGNLLKKAAIRLRLAEHTVMGTADSHPIDTCASADLQVFRGQDEEFYMKNYWRAFPPEHPEITTHLPEASRGQSIMWRKLRPEFCSRYDVTTLSPDALALASIKSPDRNKHDEAVKQATVYLVDTLIPNLAESLSSRDYILPLSDGLGLDITAELHSRGISMRHLGYLRSLLWRVLPGTSGVFFSEKKFRPTTDLYQELRHGDKVRFVKLNLNFVVALDGKAKIVHGSVPISTVFMGQSVKGQLVRAGFISTEKNADALRSVLLGEMVARTVKALVRLQCRNYARKTCITSAQMTLGLLVEYLNIVTGAHVTAARGMQDVIYEALRERFGPHAVRPSERAAMHDCLDPVILYTVKRILTMLGAQLNPNCLSDFVGRPMHFLFCEADILEVAPVVRHNIPIMTFADATLITMKANAAAEVTYHNAVKADEPKLYYKMFERKGSRTALNAGVLGKDYDGMYARGCNLWLPGPISSDPLSRCVAFSPEAQSFLDCKYDPVLVPPSFYAPFSIELFVKCTGGADSLRVIFMSGRYGLVINREGYYCFMCIDGTCEITIKVCLNVIDRFDHLIFTYDGTNLRGFVNGIMQLETEIEQSMKERRSVFENEIKEATQAVLQKEDEEKSNVKNVTNLQAEAFFTGKQGTAWLKQETQDIMESGEFQALNIGANAENDQEAMKEKRKAALKQAKARYTTDLYVKNVKEVKQKYKLQIDEIKDKEKKARDEAAMRSRTALRIGAAPPNANSHTATDLFFGEIACFQFYDYPLPFDRIREHCSTARTDRNKDAQRLHAMAAVKYEEALSMASDDELVLTGFAQSLVEYLKVELSGLTRNGVSKGKVKIMHAIDKFKAIGVPAGIAAILKALPLEAEYGILAVKAFSAVKFLDKAFFMRQFTMSRKDLVHLPAGFALDSPANPKEFIDVAAGMYAEVVRDHSQAFVYGETDLSWLSELTSSELIVSLVKHARDDKSLKMVRVGELFKAVGRTKLSVINDDVAILCAYSTLTIGYDFAGCHLLTNACCSSLSRSKNLRVISFENCYLIDNIGIRYLEEIAESLEAVNFAGLVNVTDEGLAPLFRKCQRLTSVNVSNCSHVTHEVLHLLALNNRRLATLHAAGTQIKDSGMSLICSALSEKSMTSLDVSMCRDISDYGAISIGESVPNLKFLNINGLSRISDKGTRALCARCWFLQTLSLEDVFLLDDKAFRFDLAYDGRIAAQENMLKSLVTLNLRDCVNLTDQGIQALSERCRKIETLILRGCDKLTNKALQHMTQPYEDNFAMCDSFKVLDIAHCAGIDAKGVLEILPLCGILEELRLSGMVSVDDAFVQQMCLKCATIQRLTLQKCVFLSDAALCAMADYLWLEWLDISGCRRVTDDGLEVLTVACTGLVSLLLNGVGKITSRTINSIARNSTVILELEVQQCPLLQEKALDDLQTQWPHLHIKSDFVEKTKL